MSHPSPPSADPTLSAAEQELLKEIAAAGTRTRFSLVGDITAFGVLPALAFGSLRYMQHLAAQSEFALCRLHGTFYIPENGLLEKTLTVAMLSLAFMATMMAHFMIRRQRQLRLMHQLLQRMSKQSAG